MIIADVEEQPLVSVWMITYNHEKYIRQSLESVLMQKTTFKFEIVIGEDCSTDGTRIIIQELEKQYPTIIKPIYHKKNVGAMRNG
jgi:glycosyltransferase involved in cell wall biosynthesis